MAAKFDLIRRHGGEHGLHHAATMFPGLRSEIELEIAHLKGIHPDRCVVTGEYRDALQRVLDKLG